MTIGQVIQKAVLLLDLKNDTGRAVAILREALAQPQTPSPDLLQAHVLLGELLLQVGEPGEGVTHLRAALEVALPEVWGDVADADLARARDLLGSAGLQG